MVVNEGDPAGSCFKISFWLPPRRTDCSGRIRKYRRLRVVPRLTSMFPRCRISARYVLVAAAVAKGARRASPYATGRTVVASKRRLKGSSACATPSFEPRSDRVSRELLATERTVCASAALVTGQHRDILSGRLSPSDPYRRLDDTSTADASAAELRVRRIRLGLRM